MGTLITGKSKNRSGYSKVRSRQTPTYNPESSKYHYVDRYGEPTSAYWHKQYTEKEIARVETLSTQERSSTLGQNMLVSKEHKKDIYEHWTPWRNMGEVEAGIKLRKEVQQKKKEK